jgi:hypothetical protein
MGILFDRDQASDHEPVIPIVERKFATANLALCRAGGGNELDTLFEGLDGMMNLPLWLM